MLGDDWPTVPPESDCAKCACRCDGALATYCYHSAFDKSHPGLGPKIRLRNGQKVPTWCPGIIPLDEGING